MSIFDGRIREFPDLFVDNFSTSFLNFDRRQVFFLSHAHSDHMRGLDSALFKDQFLAHPRATFFASVETKELLSCQRKYRDIAVAIVTKAINETFTIYLGPAKEDGKKEFAENIVAQNAIGEEPMNHGIKTAIVSATLIPAQHCPGSVSIYLSDCRDDVRVLYTGDYRWEEPQYQDLSFLRPFHPTNAALTNLYLDTTFCSDETLVDFPSRLLVASKILEEVSKWLREDRFAQGTDDPSKKTDVAPKNALGKKSISSNVDSTEYVALPRIVHFNSKSRCGHEKLFAFICEHLSTKIHVDEARIGEYGNIHGVASIFTSDPSSTRLHACAEESGCFSASDPNLLTVTASTQWWTRGMGGAGVGPSTSDFFMERVSPNHLRFLYSFHPSLKELRHLVSTLKPLRITPTAASTAPAGVTTSSVGRMLNLLRVENFSQGSSSTSSLSSASSKGGKLAEESRDRKKPKTSRTTRDSWSLLFDSDEEVDFRGEGKLETDNAREKQPGEEDEKYLNAEEPLSSRSQFYGILGEDEDEGKDKIENKMIDQGKPPLDRLSQIPASKKNFLFESISSSDPDDVRSSSSLNSKATSKSSTVENAALRCASSDSKGDSMYPATNDSCDVSRNNSETNGDSSRDALSSERQPTIPRRVDETICYRDLSPQSTSELDRLDQKDEVGLDEDDDLILVSVVEAKKKRTTFIDDDDDERLLKMWRK